MIEVGGKTRCWLGLVLFGWRGLVAYYFFGFVFLCDSILHLLLCLV